MIGRVSGVVGYGSAEPHENRPHLGTTSRPERESTRLELSYNLTTRCQLLLIRSLRAMAWQICQL